MSPTIDLEKKLSLKDKFRFACGPDVPCFTECCGKLELLLTPYDVLRLRRRVGLSFDDFLERHGIVRWKTPHGFPEIMMKMESEAGRRCPFVTPDGCTVYEDRPGACRIYPLGRAASKHPMDGSLREFYFTVREDHCRGFEENREWTVEEWTADQGIEDYNRFNDLLMELFALKKSRPRLSFTPQHIKMFMMSCYNPERFREFVFKSGFLSRFEVEPDLVETLKDDDVTLLEFAFRWLKFALFQEPVLTIRRDVPAGPPG